MDKKINIVIGADIEDLKKGFSDAVKVVGTSGKKIENLNDATRQSIEDAFDKIANGQNTKRAVVQLQNLALKVAALGPEFQDQADKIVQAAGRIKDNVGDVGAQIQYFSSDTRRLDAVISGVQGIAGAFEVAQGAAALFGKEDENLQKAMVKIAATMSVVQGLQQIQNVLQQESALMTGINTLAQKGLNAALLEVKATLLSNPYTAAAVAVAALAAAVYVYSQRTTESEAALKRHIEFQKKINDAVGDAKGNANAQISQLNIYAAIVNDTTKSEKSRIAALEQLKTLGIDTYGINIQNANSLQILNGRIKEQINLINAKNVAEAYSQLVSQKMVDIAKKQTTNQYKLIQSQIALLESNRNNLLAQNEFSAAAQAGNAILLNKAKLAKITAADEAELNNLLKLQESALLSLNDAEGNHTKNTEQSAKAAEKQAEAEKKKNDAIVSGLNKAMSESQKWFDKQQAQQQKDIQDPNKDLFYSDRGVSGQAKQADEQKQFQADMLKGHSDFIQEEAQLTGEELKTQQDKVNAMQKFLDANKEQLQKEGALYQLKAAQDAQFAADNAKFTEALNSQMQGILSGGFEQIGQSIGDSILNGNDAMASAMRIMIESIGDFITAYGKALIAYGVAKIAFNEALASLNPAAAIVAGTITVAAGYVVKNMAPKMFADGGIVSGPTLGMVGEYAGASTNPEVIAPLDKLKSMIQPVTDTENAFIAETRLSGTDLQILLKRTERNLARG